MPRFAHLFGQRQGVSFGTGCPCGVVVASARNGTSGTCFCLGGMFFHCNGLRELSETPSSRGPCAGAPAHAAAHFPTQGTLPCSIGRIGWGDWGEETCRVFRAMLTGTVSTLRPTRAQHLPPEEEWVKVVWGGGGCRIERRCLRVAGLHHTHVRVCSLHV